MPSERAAVRPSRGHRTLPGVVGCAVVSAAFLLVFAASGTPIPLYARYRDAGLVNSGQLSWTAVVYFVAAMTSLLVTARLSSHLGRRPVALAAVVLAAAGCLVLLDVTGLPVLLTGRVLQGLACGLAPSAVGAWVVDSVPERAGWVGAAVTGSGSMVGLTIGALLSGAFAEYSPVPVLGYLVVAAALLLLGVAMLFVAETAPRQVGAWVSLRPQVRVPAAARPLLPVAAAVAVATWALGGFYQAFSPLVAADQLGTRNTLVAAALFSAYMAPAVVGSPVAARLSAATAQRFGVLVFVLGLAGLLVAVRAGSVGLFLAASVVAGIAQAVAYTGGLQGLLATAGPEERGGLLSAVYLISYAGAAIPSLVAGRVTVLVGMFGVLVGYAALGVVAAILTCAWPRRDRSGPANA